MTLVSQVLNGLTNLYAESKRRNSTLRLAIDLAQREAACMQAGAPIASLPPSAQSVLCAPFILALDPKNPKTLASSMQSLLMLASSSSFPEPCLQDALQALHTLVPRLAMDMHLKTLQLLPMLVMNHCLRRSDFSLVLLVSANLLNSSNAVVHNTAAAALHQIFASLFERLDARRDVSKERLQPDTEEAVHGVKSGSHTLDALVDAAALVDADARVALMDAEPQLLSEELWMCYHVTSDLCSVLCSEPLDYFPKEVRFSTEFSLDVLENIVHGNGRHFSLPELLSVLQKKLCPSLLTLMQTKTNTFPIFVRSLKLLYSLTRFSALSDQTGAILSFTNRLAVSESTPRWQLAALAELYGLILADFSCVKILYHPRRASDLVTDMVAVLHEMVPSESFLLNGYALFLDRICIPLENGPVLAKDCALRVPVIDHLEKSDPPAVLPDLYLPHLVLNDLLAFATGVSKFVTALSTDSLNPETLEANVEFITSLNESIFPRVMALFQKFIYSCMSLEYFHMTVRCLQRYTHAIGLLGLSKQRDAALLFLAACIMKSAHEEASPVPAGNSSLLALGGSIVESLSSTMQGANPEKAPVEKKGSSEPEPKTRAFNSRQVLCLRALINLATSLGSTLQHSWSIVLVAFLWADYFINGPDTGVSGRRESQKYGADPALQASEVEGLEKLKHRFFENVAQYQESSLGELVQALISIHDSGSNEVSGACPYNKSYFLNMLATLGKLDYANISLYDSQVRDSVSEFFCKISMDRASAYESRTYAVDCFTEIIVQVTKTGFREKSEASAEALAQKSVTAFSDFLQKLLALGTPKEYLVLNCETEMHLAILSTLHGLIDEYDKYYQNSWDVVFRILNTAFVKSSDQNKNLMEKIQRLVSTSFDTLKLILDEFTTSLPFDQLESLIDSLMNFCSQTYDLNISFSAVSYFWLISDCIFSEGRTMEISGASELEDIAEMAQLKHFLSQASTGNSVSYQALTAYLLAQLSTLATDFRDQVREGAIQTLFQILDVRGRQLYSWRLIYDIVMPPLFLVRVPQEGILRKSVVESYNLKLSGLVSVYSKYMINIQDVFMVEKVWQRIVTCFSKILLLDWNELDLTVFQSLRDLSMCLNQVENVPAIIVEVLYGFWSSVSVRYDFVQPEYQETLAIHIQTFQYLYKMMGQLSMPQASRATFIMNKCVKYPVLKPATSDETRPSNLQRAVFENLQSVLESSEDEQICALVVQQLAEISVFPYGIKSRIEKKLKSKFEGKLKIPSFIAISQLSINLISVSLHRLPDMSSLIDEEFQLGQIVRSLLQSVYNQEPRAEPDPAALWVKSNDIIAQLILRLMDLNPERLKENRDVWQLLMECLVANFSGNNGNYDVRQYERLSRRILPQFFRSGHHDLIQDFVTQVYLHSYVYEINQVEKELMESSGGALGGYYRLSEFQFDESFGSTEACQVKENREMRLKCLAQLLEFPKEGGFGSQITKEMLLTRVAFTLRRFVADERLVESKPLPQVQEEELRTILGGFLHIAQDMEQTKLKGIMQLLSRCMEYSERISGIEGPMKALLALGL